MRHIIFSFLAASLLLAGCEESNVQTPDSLIFEIAESVNKVNIDPADLPTNVKQVLTQNYFETYVESAAEVTGKGYEVILGNEDQVYFRHDGMHLKGSDRHDRHGPCGRGIPVRPEDLPAEITEYIATNFPDAQIFRGKQFPRGYVVLISGRRLVLFNSDLEFVGVTSVFHFCDAVGDHIDLGDLRESIMTYIEENYPGTQVVAARIVRGKVVVGLVSPTLDSRIILVFDLDGNFLFERG